MVDPLGTWGASKPSDGLGIKFPQYSYFDMVQANYRMLHDHLKIAHAALATGVSMGGTQTYVWGVMHPEYVSAIMPIGGTTQSDAEDPVGNWTFQLMTAAIQSDPVLVNQGQGRVYGGELLVRQELFKGFFGWVAYTISRSERKDHPDDPWRLFQYDQTHILTVIGSYKFGRGFQVGIRFRYVTGNPYTPVVGNWLDLNSGRYFQLDGPTYGARLGSFNQLDVRFDKTWEFRKWKLGLYVDIQNVYNAKSPEGYQYNFDFTKSQPVAGIPFFPAVGLRGDF
jgi:pimeloyl-ACP methyl ester carboxylesterase